MNKIHLYDASTIDQIIWPDTDEGKLARAYLVPLVKEGAENYIKNAKTKLYVLTLDDLVVPISVNEKEYDNSYLLSTYFVVANLKEKLEHSSGLAKKWSRPLIALFGQLMKWIKINKVVIINNWLLTTNIYPDLNTAQLQALTKFLKSHFPDHYFMFRSINTFKSSTVYNGLNLENYRMIPSRHVYIYDPKRRSELSSHKIRNQLDDKRKITKNNYEIQEVTSLSEEEITRALELYQNVYVSKYSKYSPIYTEKYLRQMLDGKAMHFKLLKKEGKIFGVTGFLRKNGYLLCPFFGYDTTLPKEEGLYRMLSAVIMQEIESAQLISHQGSGASDFKKWRGCSEEQEYVAIYDHHLPFMRRLFWILGERFSSKLQH